MFLRSWRSWLKLCTRRQLYPIRKARVARPLGLRVEQLEDRSNPSPFTASGGLGALSPSTSVVFNTTNGDYKVDGGSWLTGGSLSGDPGATTMLYNFTTISLGSGVSVSASGDYALGLLATGNISIGATIDLSGSAAPQAPTATATSAVVEAVVVEAVVPY